MVATPRIFNVEETTVKGKINTPFAAVPHTTINGADGNPRRMADLTQDLKVSLGVERIMFRALTPVEKELGDAGENVYTPNINDDRIRFVGDWQFNYTINGSKVFCDNTSSTDYMEITFYGTGLNILHHYDGNNANFVASIDGGAESANLYNTSLTSILNIRNYGIHGVIPVTSGLSLGWHTIKIRNIAATNQILTYGIEILNESSQLVVNPGQPFQGGYAAELASQTLLDYSPTALTGTKGGRVVTYIDSEGNLGQAVQIVDANQLNLASADHANEEIVRKIHWEEFGYNRADDFTAASLSSQDLAFTLDDGTTTLVGNNVTGNAGDMGLFDGSAHVTLTFVGTGLDLLGVDDPDDLQLGDVYIDGVDVGTHSRSANIIPIVSGLPYGTHTVKFDNTIFTATAGFCQGFIVYQPKKPSIPAGAIELADYNVMADFANPASAANGYISTGVLKKMPLREYLYVDVGAGWAISGVDTVSFDCGFNLNTNAVGDYVEYTFFGTGIEITGLAQPSLVSNFTISIDGSSNLSGFTTNLLQTSTGPTFTPSTGVFTGTPAAQEKYKISVSGLTLGAHTIRVTQNTAATPLYLDGFDIITPIHVSHNIAGSLSIKDLRNSPQEEGKADNSLPAQTGLKQYDLIVSSSNGSWVTTLAKGVPYQVEDGSWRLKGNITATIATDNAVNMYIAGIKTIGIIQSVDAFPHSELTWANAFAQVSSNNIKFNSGVNQTSLSVSFDIALAEKPTWVED